MIRVLENLRPALAVGACMAVSAVLLAGAHLFERVGNMPPCLLCLDQREVHWAALALGAATLGLSRLVPHPDRIFAAVLGAMTLVYLFSGGLAGYHAGVEWGFWPGPQGCAVNGDMALAAARNASLNAEDILSNLSEKAPGPSCTDAAWRMMGISMAGYNTLISFALTGFAVVACRQAARGLRQDRFDSAALAQ